MQAKTARRWLQNKPVWMQLEKDDCIVGYKESPYGKDDLNR
jgi:hypothetical protein